ncbi:hypothetical protein NIES2109_52280 [Nostoc sp. HK-01]|nr:hypothetical protein NIES2109_52280 [Nostoc sp. HK-01]
MDFPRYLYSPLRPQTTIAIDQVNTTNSDTQPNVKIPIVLNFANNYKRSLIFIIPGTGHWKVGSLNLIVSTPYPLLSIFQMNRMLDTQLMAERLESLKAGMIGVFSLSVTWLITNLFNALVLARYFDILTSLQVTLHWYLFVSWAIASFSGLLFGVTYRYIIRQDQNLQLKAGGVMAFGLVRGLAQIEFDWSLAGAVLASESVLWFIVAAIALNQAIQVGWVKPFPSI